MKKVIILIGWVIVGGVVGGMAAAALSVRQATRVPNWYTSQTEQTSSQPNAAELAPSAIALDSSQIQDIVSNVVTNSPISPELRQTAERITTRIEDGQLKTGTVINVSSLPLEQLQPAERERVEQVLSLVPGLANRDVFIGIEGSPKIQNGQVQLDRDMVIKVGNLSLPLAMVARQLGMSIEQLEQLVNQELQAQGLDVGTVEIVGDRLVIQQ
ncbi:hypothetical protein ACQ4M4_19230 [Leptolyngbya sp. AN02str]|uniref:hypothetical protein n=1 Tax=Leptolyngbya sp. AN02str TaxID=3423363 RepID=UPI003D313F60